MACQLDTDSYLLIRQNCIAYCYTLLYSVVCMSVVCHIRPSTDSDAIWHARTIVASNDRLRQMGVSDLGGP